MKPQDDTAEAPPMLVAAGTLEEFFMTAIQQTSNKQQLELETHTQFYLVRLLTRFSRPEELFAESPEGAPFEALALLLARATQASREERIRLTRHIGDLALFVAGFFTPYFERRAMGLDYYVRMGGSAYSDVSALVATDSMGRTFAPLFGELASRFVDVVDVLNEISDGGDLPANHDVWALYDRFFRTHSRRIGSYLMREGLLPAAPVAVS